MSAFLGAGRPQRFTVQPAQASNVHRRLERAHRLEQILSVRVVRTVAADHTVKWNGQRWGVPRAQVCAGLPGARAEIERRLDGSHWLRFRGRYLPIENRNPESESKPNTLPLPTTLGGNRGSGHFYLAKNRTFLLCVDTTSETC
jgi:hypothetical protein